MEDKKYPNFLKDYYDEKKRLIDVIGFVGIIAGLFLQITQFQGDSLKMVQTFLLLVFAVLLSYLLVDFLIRLVSYKPETPKSIAVNSILIFITVWVFIFNLVKFVYVSFNNQLATIFVLTKFGLLLLISVYFSDATKFLSQKFGREKVWLFINELLYTALLFLFFIYHKKNFDKRLYILPAIFIFLNVPLAYKWISKKTFYWLTALTLLAYAILLIKL